ncbi:anthranilate phosphoribosyltransferase, partial [Magnetococcales bacterium HHB-1]
MMTIQSALAQLVLRKDLSMEASRAVMDQIMSGKATPAQIGAYITALRMKGETIDEIAGAAQAMREKAHAIHAPGTAVDTCGTGGDGSGTFNISTTSSFLVAACGLTVAKHGNRSISSKSGSADLLQALGVNIEAEPEVVEKCIEKAGIGFMFAPKHHGAMRHALAPRQELALRTIFNLLGPLTNPAGAAFQVLGVYDAAWVEPLAHVLGRLGSRRALVVHGEDGLDEITTTGITHVAELHDDKKVTTYTIHPEQFGLNQASAEDLAGGDAQTNAKITLDILDNQEGAKKDIVALNAAAAIYITGA